MDRLSLVGKKEIVEFSDVPFVGRKNQISKLGVAVISQVRSDPPCVKLRDPIVFPGVDTFSVSYFLKSAFV